MNSRPYSPDEFFLIRAGGAGVATSLDGFRVCPFGGAIAAVEIDFGTSLDGFLGPFCATAFRYDK
jgi:hypothetical protein